MHRGLSNMELVKRRTLNIKRLDYSDTEINCPEVFVCFGKSKGNIQRALLDTGAQANLIGLQHLIDLGYDESNILRTEKFNLRPSSELVEDCFLGKSN